MARTQIVATSGNRRLAPDQVAAMNARRAGLYRDLAQQESNRQRSEDLRFRNKEFRQNERIARDQQALAEKSQRMSAGISAANLGMSASKLAASNPGGFGNRAFGDLMPNVFGSGGYGSMFGDFTLGQGVASTLAGAGASMLADKDAPRWKKALYGAGGGMALNLLAGGGDSFGSSIGGAAFGTLGSLFG